MDSYLWPNRFASKVRWSWNQIVNNYKKKNMWIKLQITTSITCIEYNVVDKNYSHIKSICRIVNEHNFLWLAHFNNVLRGVISIILCNLKMLLRNIFFGGDQFVQSWEKFRLSLPLYKIDKGNTYLTAQDGREFEQESSTRT